MVHHPVRVVGCLSCSAELRTPTWGKAGEHGLPKTPLGSFYIMQAGGKIGQSDTVHTVTAGYDREQELELQRLLSCRPASRRQTYGRLRLLNGAIADLIAQLDPPSESAQLRPSQYIDQEIGEPLPEGPPATGNPRAPIITVAGSKGDAVHFETTAGDTVVCRPPSVLLPRSRYETPLRDYIPTLRTLIFKGFNRDLGAMADAIDTASDLDKVAKKLGQRSVENVERRLRAWKHRDPGLTNFVEEALQRIRDIRKAPPAVRVSH